MKQTEKQKRATGKTDGSLHNLHIKEKNMKKICFDFYIDESGSFEDSQSEASLVGGLLVKTGYLTDEKIKGLLPSFVHCCEMDNRDREKCLSALEVVKSEGARFVIFENKERINVINGDITYLNIISEGLLQLFSDLALEHPGEQVTVNVTAATRKNVAKGHGIIGKDEYTRRLEEKLLLAEHREGKAFCAYTLSFEDARYCSKLDFADIICNTFLTKGKNKFSEEQKRRIAAVYDEKYIYSVFEAATVGYLKFLMSERRYGEAMLQICALKKLTGVTKIRNSLLEEVSKASPVEFDAFMSYMSMQIGLCNNTGNYAEGIALAENYKKYFLSVLSESKALHDKVEFRIFDTDFYILTMFDHMGNIEKCTEYMSHCRERLGSINHSWEHIEYYFRYRIRELNVLMGRFEFDEALSRADELADILKNAKELFGLIETFDGTAAELRSELLGKVYGIKLEAYINLLQDRPGLFDKALEVSDLAIAEFSEPSDINRQYHYRCMLMTIAGRTEDALQCLMKIYDIPQDAEDRFKRYIDRVLANNLHPDDFALWHYLDVMLLAAERKNAAANKMADAIMNSPVPELYSESADNSIHPRYLVLWKLGKLQYLHNNIHAGDAYFNAAKEAALSDKAKLTMRSFAVSIEADLVLQKWQKEPKFKHSKYLQRIQKHLDELPKAMKQHFLGADDKAAEKNLQRLSRAYLK